MKILIRIIKDAKQFYKPMLIGLGGLILFTITNLAAPEVLRQFFGFISNQSPDLVKKTIIYAFILLIIFVLRFYFSYVRSYYSHVAAWYYVADLRVRVYDHLQKLSLKYFHDKQTGQLMSTAGNDTRDIEDLIAHAVPDLIVSVLTFVGVLIMLFRINVTLAVYALFTTPATVFLVRRFATKVHPIFTQGRQKLAEYNAVLHDNLNGLKEIQAFNQQKKELERMTVVSDRQRDLILDALRLSAIYHPAMTLVTNIGTVLVVGIGGILAVGGNIPIEDIMAFMLYLGIFYEPINTLSRLNEGLQNTIACAARVFDVLDTDSDVTECENPVNLENVKGDIVFNNVNFAYIDDVDVLKNINIKINHGEMVAVVGPTGVGKTTIANLIGRFYDPTDGNITIDGVDLKNASLRSLRDNVSIVLQDVFLFNGSVADNIAYGVDGASMERIMTAAKNANAHEFVLDLPEGYDTIIGERGVKLSGGQKQRLSIARALLRDTPIIILDEATASVDMATEKLIHEAIDSVIQNRTTIIIAHRLASIKNADKIVVLKEGEIVQMGRHEELIAQEGLYAELCSYQF